MLALCLPESVPEGIQAWLLAFDLAAPIEDADCVRMVVTRAALRRQLAERFGAPPSLGK